MHAGECIRAVKRKPEQWPRIHHFCPAHVVVRASNFSASYLPKHFTGLVSMPLCFKGSGDWARFHRAFRKVASSLIVFRVGAPSLEERYYNMVALRSFIGSDGFQQKRSILVQMFPKGSFLDREEIVCWVSSLDGLDQDIGLIFVFRIQSKSFCRMDRDIYIF